MSNTMTISIPLSLQKALSEEARKTGVSTSKYVTTLLKSGSLQRGNK